MTFPIQEVTLANCQQAGGSLEFYSHKKLNSVIGLNELEGDFFPEKT